MVISLTREQQQLVSQVQHNCNISDANHAGNFTLCIYLLKMREYYRWLNNLEFADELESGKMSAWLREREEIWDQVMDDSFKKINFNNQTFDVFDNTQINSTIQSQKLFYHAGIGQKEAHHFFVAELIDSYIDPSTKTRITITGKEFARDLTAPPAMSNQHDIIIRQESLKRLCWERFQEWDWNQYDNAMGTALSFYPFQVSVNEALQSMVEVEQNTLIQHEIGEMRISRQLGAEWSNLILKIMGTKAELLARSVRDHLADCLNTLPFLIEQNNPASLHFYFANMAYIRKELFPSAIQAYQKWGKTGSLEPLIEISQNAAPHWESTLQSILQTQRDTESICAKNIANLIEQATY